MASIFDANSDRLGHAGRFTMASIFYANSNRQVRRPGCYVLVSLIVIDHKVSLIPEKMTNLIIPGVGKMRNIIIPDYDRQVRRTGCCVQV